jgi:thioredoxin
MKNMKKRIYIYLAIAVVIAAIVIGAFSLLNREKAVPKVSENKVDKRVPIHLTKADFITKVANFETNPTEWKYLGDKPCIIDFYATWCGPCKTIAPIMEDLAKEYYGQIYIYKVDVDAEPEIAGAYGIQSIPTIFLCPMNGTPQMIQGAMPKESFQKAITEFLLKK